MHLISKINIELPKNPYSEIGWVLLILGSEKNRMKSSSVNLEGSASEPPAAAGPPHREGKLTDPQSAEKREPQTNKNLNLFLPPKGESHKFLRCKSSQPFQL